MDEISKSAWKHALKNAFDYGKADAKFVVGKVIAEVSSAKKEMKRTAEEVAKAVEEVNALERGEIGELLKDYEFEVKPAEAERKIRLPQGVEGHTVTRFLPEPNGFLHIGHAKAAWLSREAAFDYRGKCLLRFDDTNPETEASEFVQAIRDDLKWLGFHFDGEGFTSDLMPELYKQADALVSKGNAYVCFCERDAIAKSREEGKACACRSHSAEENKDFWEKMKGKKFGEGKTVLRLKGDLKAENTVMRDPTLYRIITAEHYRQQDKYWAWPTYDFEVSVTDSLTGVTHALRSKEYELRDELYYHILDLLGLRKPVVYDFSRLNIRGTLLSKRFLKPLIEQKKVLGWDDPRLPTIRGLKRRGVLPEAIKKFVLSFGLSKVESEPSFEALLVENRRLLDETAEHYFAVFDPIRLKVQNAPEKEVRLAKHPLRKESDFRTVKTGNEFFVPSEDAEKFFKAEVVRLKDLYNVKINAKTALKIDGEFAGNDFIEGKKIQWVPAIPANEAVLCELIVLSDLIGEDGGFNEKSLAVRRGYCEKACASLRKGDVVQFERVGFARLDDEKKMSFVLSC